MPTSSIFRRFFTLHRRKDKFIRNLAVSAYPHSNPKSKANIGAPVPYDSDANDRKDNHERSNDDLNDSQPAITWRAVRHLVSSEREKYRPAKDHGTPP